VKDPEVTVLFEGRPPYDVSVEENGTEYCFLPTAFLRFACAI